MKATRIFLPVTAAAIAPLVHRQVILDCISAQVTDTSLRVEADDPCRIECADHCSLPSTPEDVNKCLKKHGILHCDYEFFASYTLTTPICSVPIDMAYFIVSSSAYAELSLEEPQNLAFAIINSTQLSETSDCDKDTVPVHAIPVTDTRAEEGCDGKSPDELITLEEADWGVGNFTFADEHRAFSFNLTVKPPLLLMFKPHTSRCIGDVNDFGFIRNWVKQPRQSWKAKKDSDSGPQVVSGGAGRWLVMALLGVIGPHWRA